MVFGNGPAIKGHVNLLKLFAWKYRAFTRSETMYVDWSVFYPAVLRILMASGSSQVGFMPVMDAADF